MNVMLTGNEGYIGQKLHAMLNAQPGTNVFTFDEYGNERNWELEFDKRFTADFKYDVVIHAGAIMDSFYAEPDIYFWNYHTTTQIARYCRHHDAFMLFFSTCQAITPISHYGWSKRCASDYVESIVKNHCIVRPFIVYGDEYGRPSKLSAVAKIIKGELPVIFEPWERDWIHVRDVVRAIHHILTNRVTGIYDLGTGEGIEARALFEKWHAWSGDPLPPIVGPGDPRYLDQYPNPIVAKRLLPGFEVQWNVLDYLENMQAYGNKVY